MRERSSSRFPRRLAAAAALGLAAGGGYALDRAARPRPDCGPMIQLAAPGQWAVTWSARSQTGPVRAGRVLWTDEAGNERAALAEAGPAGYLTARLDLSRGGSPAGYRLQNAGLLGRWVDVGAPQRLAGLPRPAAPFRFLVFGDSGSGGNSLYELVDRMAAAAPALVLHAGDVVYPGGFAKDYPQNFFHPLAPLLRLAPFMPSPGNHDYGARDAQPYVDVFSLPENGPPDVAPERNYWFDFGAARFVSLDTNRASERGVISEQAMRDSVAPWLRRVLSEPGPRWRFVYFHHPPFTGGASHPAESQAFVKGIFVPVFDETGVDVVFCGHNHLYERTKPLRGGRIVAPGEGTVYVTSGAGGVSLYEEVAPPPEYMEVFADRVFSFTQVDVTRDELTIAQIALSGETVDRFTLR